MKLNKIIAQLSISLLILLSITSIFAVKELPNCCPSKVNEDVIWNYINKITPSLEDKQKDNPSLTQEDYENHKNNKFNEYKYLFNKNIEDCNSYNIDYLSRQFEEEYEKDMKDIYYSRGISTREVAISNSEEYKDNLNKEISRKNGEVNMFINNHQAILENGEDIVNKMSNELIIFRDKELSSKLYNYGKISGEEFDSCYKSSIIYSCYQPCMDEIDAENEIIAKKSEFDISKYLDYDLCYDKCSIQENLMSTYYDKINTCSAEKMADFKWIIPYMKYRSDILNQCDMIYTKDSVDFKGVYSEPNGGTIHSKIKNYVEIKKEEENIPKKDLTPSNIKIKTWGNDLTEGKNYKLHISTNFFGKDSNGEEMLMPSFKVPTLEFKYNLPKNAELTLKYKIDSTYLKDSSTLEGDIWISKANLQGVTEPIKVEVFVSGYPLNSKMITIYPRERLEILSLSKIKEDINAWDDSWSTYKLTVNEPENRYIKYTIFSTSKNSQIFVKGFEYNKIATYTGKEQTLKFGWKAPKISKDARINYAKHLESLTTNLAIKGGSELLGNKLNSAVPNSANIKKRFDNAMTGIGTTNAGKQIYSSSSGPKEGEDWSFYLTKNLVNGFVNTEGYFGDYLDKSPYSLQYKMISYSLVPMQEWYSIVDEMINISQAKMISQNERIIVTAENNLGDKDTAEYIVTINGFERVLK